MYVSPYGSDTFLVNIYRRQDKDKERVWNGVIDVGVIVGAGSRERLEKRERETITPLSSICVI